MGRKNQNASTITIERVKKTPSRRDSRGRYKKFRLKPWHVSIIYISSVLLVSFLLSWWICASLDDVFALTMSGEPRSVFINEGDKVGEVARELKKYGVIEHPLLFNFYTRVRGKTISPTGGEYSLSPSMNYDQIIAALNKPPKPDKEE